jgi:hypothetical protein
MKKSDKVELVFGAFFLALAAGSVLIPFGDYGKIHPSKQAWKAEHETSEYHQKNFRLR